MTIQFFLLQKSGYNVNNDIRARYSAKFRKTPDPFKNKLTADSPFLTKVIHSIY